MPFDDVTEAPTCVEDRLLELAAGEQQNAAALTRLLRRYPDINLDHADGNGDTALHLACRADRLGVVRRLLAEGADINAANHRGETPLFAAIAGSNRIVRYLLAQTESVDVNWRTMYGHRPMQLAVMQGNAAAIIELCKQPALDLKVIESGAWPVMHMALESSAEWSSYHISRVIKWLVGRGARIGTPRADDGANEVNRLARLLHGRTLVRKEKVAALSALINAGADPWQPDHAGNTCFRYLDYAEVWELRRALRHCWRQGGARSLRDGAVSMDMLALGIASGA